MKRPYCPGSPTDHGIDRAKEAEREYAMVQEASDVRFVRPETHDELIGALRDLSDVTILTAHGIRLRQDEKLLWRLSRHDYPATRPIRPKDVVAEVGTLGARHMIVAACDMEWTPERPGLAAREWKEAALGATRLFIAEGELTYGASYGFVKRVLHGLRVGGEVDLGQLVQTAQESFGRSLKPGEGKARFVEVKGSGQGPRAQ